MSHFLIIGDDYQSYCFGYDSNAWKIIEYDPTLGELNEVASTLYEFLDELFESQER